MMVNDYYAMAQCSGVRGSNLRSFSAEYKFLRYQNQNAVYQLSVNVMKCIMCRNATMNYVLEHNMKFLISTTCY